MQDSVNFEFFPLFTHTITLIRCKSKLIVSGIEIHSVQKELAKKTGADWWDPGCGRNQLWAQPWPDQLGPIFFEKFSFCSNINSLSTIKFVSVFMTSVELI